MTVKHTLTEHTLTHSGRNWKRMHRLLRQDEQYIHLYQVYKATQVDQLT